MNFTCNRQTFCVRPGVFGLGSAASHVGQGGSQRPERRTEQEPVELEADVTAGRSDSEGCTQGECTVILRVILVSMTLTSIVRVVCFCMFLFSLATFAIHHFNHQHHQQPWYKQSEKMKNLNSHLIKRKPEAGKRGGEGSLWIARHASTAASLG